MAAIFATDLLAAVDRALDAFGPPGWDEGPGPVAVVLAVTVPIDEDGLVVVSAAPPELTSPGAVRRPGALTVAVAAVAEARRGGGGTRRAAAPPRPRAAAATLGLELHEGRRLRIPGVEAAGAPGPPAELATLACEVDAGGLTFGGRSPDGAPVALAVGETPARELATALLITVGVKLAKAGRPGG